MPEAPITTIGIIRGRIPPNAFEIELPNGKRIPGHLPKRLAALESRLAEHDRVNLELTPYDFEKARIVGIVQDA